MNLIFVSLFPITFTNSLNKNQRCHYWMSLSSFPLKDIVHDLQEKFDNVFGQQLDPEQKLLGAKPPGFANTKRPAVSLHSVLSFWKKSIILCWLRESVTGINFLAPLIVSRPTSLHIYLLTIEVLKPMLVRSHISNLCSGDNPILLIFANFLFLNCHGNCLCQCF